ncbi:P-loop containing nucleoside triphosphate hydrolase protein [Aspergillus caelatus]|uniref:P-loop containing nucleoside triphosphate hydrolase protein n=1 Tax=Aspergillus caelatus TaxID=61420 RepID=A0A5N7A7Q0_9EURO|nr:P-loop containing nucleoside triphosphate hydrolase protein [Aspergillus caelatus]KAE8365725.1 P-loop containing nucleoside triphosphate hydrolase protein [Aspergillus caelatus]
MTDTSNETQVKSTYNVPDWFVKDHIKTPTEQGKSKIAIVKTPSPTIESQEDPEKYELHEDLYADFRDMVAGTILNKYENSPATLVLDPDEPSLILQARSLVYGTAILTHLAGELNVTLVNLDIGDLRNLACDFFIQDTAIRESQKTGTDSETSNGEDGTSSLGEVDDSQGCPTPPSSTCDDPGVHALDEENTKSAPIEICGIDDTGEKGELADKQSVERNEEHKQEDKQEDKHEEASGKSNEEQNHAQESAENQNTKSPDLEDDEETISRLNDLKGKPDLDEIMDIFFASRCESHAERGVFHRTKRSIQSIIEAAWTKAQSMSSSLTTNRPPVIIHLRGARSIRTANNGTKILKNLREVVQEYRQKQVPVLIITTVVEQQTVIMNSKLLTSNVSAVQFNLDTPMLSKYEAPFEEERKRHTIQQRNITVKQHLRLNRNYTVWSHLFPHDLDFDLSDTPINSQLPDLARTANQIAGSFMTKGMLEIQDIRDIVARGIRLANEDHQSPESPEEDKPHRSISDRLEEIRGSCNKYEQNLFTKVIDTEKQKVTYDDVVVEDSVKDTMKYLVRLSQVHLEGASQALVDSVNVKGALLYGPPGTGKTQLVRAMASDSSSSMIVITASDIESKWVGQTEKNISAAFSLARKLSPCILFIDEVDALLYRRSSCDQSWRRESLTQFLQEMDGLSNNKDAPFVIGATNHPMDLDEAFLRRLPYKVMFGMPGLEEREKILKIFLKEDDLDSLVSVKALAHQTEGYTGSDLRSLCGQAALDFAIEQAKSRSVNEDGTEASVKLRLGVNHFVGALRKVQPSVSVRSHREIEKFSSLFDPQNKMPWPCIVGVQFPDLN